MRLDGLHLALAGGITLGFGIAFATFIAFYSGNGAEILRMFTFYPAYEVSVAGAGVGFLWGFIEGFFVLGFFGWVYNHIHRYHE